MSVTPKVACVLDPGFAPLSLTHRAFLADAAKVGDKPIAIVVKRGENEWGVHHTRVYAQGHEAENNRYVERLVKTLLWVKGGYEIGIAGDSRLADYIAKTYCVGGEREFDANFMARVYEKPFAVKDLGDYANAPEASEKSSPVGRHLDGCRIGFDAGGSDRKVSAVIDGESVYSEEVVWFPKTKEDPSYHYEGILSAMKSAAEHMPRVDAIGVSSAGVTIKNRMMVSSLFIKVPEDQFDAKVKNIYLDVAKELGENIPIEVANDGDVTALAGAMDLNDDSVMGVAMGTSEAGGYVDENGNITGWLNELAFVPVDDNPDAMHDEWSGDVGCGVKYFSQDGVIKLAPAAGIVLDESLSPAEKLKVVQKEMENGNDKAADIYRSIGVCFGYAVAYYAMFYHIKHVLIMGRVTSGQGGVLLLDKANEVLQTEFPELAKQIQLHIPDEKSRRVGQSVAAASLPMISK